MTTQEAIKSKNACLIDVRDPYELEIDGHVKGAINIPLSEIPMRLEEIKSMPTPRIVFCRGGSRATSVLDFLNDHGIQDCYNGGGFENINEILNDSNKV